MNTVRVHTKLKPETATDLSNYAKEKGVSREYVIRNVLEKFAKRVSKGDK